MSLYNIDNFIYHLCLGMIIFFETIQSIALITPNPTKTFFVDRYHGFSYLKPSELAVKSFKPD